MNKSVFYIFIVSLSFLFSCATLNPPKEPGIDPNDIVRWTDTTKLTWADFQGQPITDAQLASEILVQMPSHFQKSTLFLPAITSVDCYMNKKASWVVKSQKKPQLLFFNQTLFDIYELYARILRKKLADASYGIADPVGVFDSIGQSVQNDASKAITQYRNETGMGANNKKIKEWSEKIAKEIKELDAYKAK